MYQKCRLRRNSRILYAASRHCVTALDHRGCSCPAICNCQTLRMKRAFRALCVFRGLTVDYFMNHESHEKHEQINASLLVLSRTSLTALRTTSPLAPCSSVDTAFQCPVLHLGLCRPNIVLKNSVTSFIRCRIPTIFVGVGPVLG